jgi:hypothetical protein
LESEAVLQAQGFTFSLATDKGHAIRYYSSERTEDVKEIIKRLVLVVLQKFVDQ